MSMEEALGKLVVSLNPYTKAALMHFGNGTPKADVKAAENAAALAALDQGAKIRLLGDGDDAALP